MDPVQTLIHTKSCSIHDIIQFCNEKELTDEQIQSAFRQACVYGKFELAKYLYFWSNKINIHMYNDLAFRWGCYLGNFEFAKWIYSFGQVDIHAEQSNNEPFSAVCKEDAFFSACYAGHLEIAKWLLTLDGKINIHINDDHIFRTILWRDREDSAKFVYSLDPVYFDNLIRNHPNQFGRYERVLSKIKN